MNLRRTILVSLFAGMLFACQPATVAPSGSPAPTTPPVSASAGVTAPPEAGATLDPDWITRPALTCGDERRFPPEALTGAGVAELGLDPAAGVLRALLAERADPAFPDTGWHRVHEEGGEVTFVARGNADTPWVHVTVGMIDGVLQPVIQGQCHLQPVAPEGVTLAHWWLDPAAPRPTAESTEIAILVREQACASGKPPIGRVLPPTIILNDDTILVAIGVALTPGNADCPNNPSFGMVLALPEPLGARALFDAGVFPPRPVTTEDPGL